MSLGSSASTQPLNSLRSSAVAILMLAVEPIENHARSPPMANIRLVVCGFALPRRPLRAPSS